MNQFFVDLNIHTPKKNCHAESFSIICFILARILNMSSQRTLRSLPLTQPFDGFSFHSKTGCKRTSVISRSTKESCQKATFE